VTATVAGMLTPSLAAAGNGGWGFLEWFFAALLGSLVALVGAFFVYLIRQLFLNPGRRARRL
jgi:nitrate reductase NapE component